MTRTLHIFEPGSAAWPMTALLARTRGVDDVVVVLGGSEEACAAAALGLTFEHRVTPTLGRGTLAWARLRVLESRGVFAGIDAVHTWSLGSLAAARLGLPGALRSATTCTVSVPPTLRLGAGIAAAIHEAFTVRVAQRCASLRFSSVSVRDAWASRFGTSAATASAVPIAPGIERMSLRDAGDVSGSAHEQARERWGVAPDERVLLALADHAPLIDARRFIFHCGVMSVGGHRLVGVVPPGAAQLERAVRFTRRHHGAWRLVIDDSPIPQLIHLADAAMPASRFSEWSAAFARRAGVRVVDPIEATGDRLAANAALLRTLEAVQATA